MIIAVDGTAGSGKGTLSKQLSGILKLKHLDTGILYRAVSLELINLKIKQNNIETIAIKIANNLSWNEINKLNNNLLRTSEVSNLSSIVAKLSKVRKALFNLQRNFAHTKYKGFNGTILDGRDIGSVILPKANYKFFLDADIKIRAKRRTEEMLNLGIEVKEYQVLKDMIERDKIDKTRENAPLIRPKDAFFIDTSAKSIKEVLRIALKVIENHEL